jgi:hypothetical protein
MPKLYASLVEMVLVALACPASFNACSGGLLRQPELCRHRAVMQEALAACRALNSELLLRPDVPPLEKERMINDAFDIIDQTAAEGAWPEDHVANIKWQLIRNGELPLVLFISMVPSLEAFLEFTEFEGCKSGFPMAVMNI